MLFRSSQNRRETYRSKLSNVVVVRFFGPLVLIVFALLLFGSTFPSWRFLPAAPLLLAALLGASVASVKVQDGAVYYRRFLRWIPIAVDELVNANSELPRLIGSLRITRYIFPWGRLYFVLDVAPVLFGEPRTPLLTYLWEQSRENEGRESGARR